jgi:hypothetical protein
MTLTITYLLLPIAPGTAAAVAHPRESFAVAVVLLVLALVAWLVRRAGTRGGLYFSTVSRIRTAWPTPTSATVPGSEKNRLEDDA